LKGRFASYPYRTHGVRAAQEIERPQEDSARRLYLAADPAAELLLRHAQVPSERFDSAGNACGLQ
jgi:hypothetical protein